MIKHLEICSECLRHYLDQFGVCWWCFDQRVLKIRKEELRVKQKMQKLV